MDMPICRKTVGNDHGISNQQKHESEWIILFPTAWDSLTFHHHLRWPFTAEKVVIIYPEWINQHKTTNKQIIKHPTWSRSRIDPGPTSKVSRD